MFFLSKSPLKNKKWRINSVNNGHHVDFGAVGYEDYTIHKNPERKNLYIQRHKKRENWNDPMTAGFWSRWILWNEPSLINSIKNTEKRFKLKIKYIR